ncbi:hypothetical protein AYO44_00635 [Planctomycetaceae bacterium SCGC AG-212-F19]|nr:hypothetical protein AYO44_00635 [Planctomycetaceae bacterium SCGC AG-212-F19]
MELAVVLPILLWIVFMAVDMGRFGKFKMTAANAARSAAFAASQNAGTMGPTGQLTSGPIYNEVMNEIKGYNGNGANGYLEIDPTKVEVWATQPLDSHGRQAVAIQVKLPFNLIIHFGAAEITYGGGFTVSETCQMRVRPG